MLGCLGHALLPFGLGRIAFGAVLGIDAPVVWTIYDAVSRSRELAGFVTIEIDVDQDGIAFLGGVMGVEPVEKVFAEPLK